MSYFKIKILQKKPSWVHDTHENEENARVMDPSDILSLFLSSIFLLDFVFVLNFPLPCKNLHNLLDRNVA